MAKKWGKRGRTPPQPEPDPRNMFGAHAPPRSAPPASSTPLADFFGHHSRGLPGVDDRYLVLPRALAEAMPLPWQQLMVNQLAQFYEVHGRLSWPAYRVVPSRPERLTDLDEEQLAEAGYLVEMDVDGEMVYRERSGRRVEDPANTMVLVSTLDPVLKETRQEQVQAPERTGPVPMNIGPQPVWQATPPPAPPRESVPPLPPPPTAPAMSAPSASAVPAKPFEAVPPAEPVPPAGPMTPAAAPVEPVVPAAPVLPAEVTVERVRAAAPDPVPEPMPEPMPESIPEPVPEPAPAPAAEPAHEPAVHSETPEPAEPAASAEPIEPIESIESSESTESADSADPPTPPSGINVVGRGWFDEPVEVEEEAGSFGPTGAEPTEIPYRFKH